VYFPKPSAPGKANIPGSTDLSLTTCCALQEENSNTTIATVNTLFIAYNYTYQTEGKEITYP
jgi:hypothetical protein